MKNTETKAKINMDETPLGALHKVAAHTHTHTHGEEEELLPLVSPSL